MFFHICFLIFQAQIQQRMHSFAYGQFDNSNRPPPILIKHLQDGRMAATAAQKLCLFKLFPIIFHDIIDALPSFVIYKILREIVDLVLSYPFLKSWLPVLNDLCDSFHRNMLIHFPKMIVAKVHFVREYEQIIHDYGPAIRQWCFRYEGYHAYFKKLINRMHNFKNVPKMLATRYRFKQCYALTHLSRLKNIQYPIGLKRILIACFTMSMKDLLQKHFGHLDPGDNLWQCKKLINESIEYCQSSIYVIDLKPNEQPVFAQIVYIVKMNEKWWILFDILHTLGFNENLFGWEIQSFGDYAMINPSESTYYYKGLDLYVVNNASYVSFTSRLTFSR